MKMARICNIVIVISVLMLMLSGCGATDGPQRDSSGNQPLSKLPSLKSSVKTRIGNQEILPQTHIAAGQLHEGNGHLVRAAEQYRLAVCADPQCVEAYNRLGIVLDRLGRFKEADEAFQKAIELAPKQAHLRNNLAFSYVMQSRWADAERELRSGLKIHPDFVRARVNLAIVLAQQELYDQAMTQFRMALPPEDAYYNMGLMYQSKKLLVEAASAYKSALKLNPEMVAAQKRLDQMTPEILEKAEKHMAMTASPVPIDNTEVTAEMSERPTTQPAVGEAIDDMDDLELMSGPLTKEYAQIMMNLSLGWGELFDEYSISEHELY